MSHYVNLSWLTQETLLELLCCTETSSTALYPDIRLVPSYGRYHSSGPQTSYSENQCHEVD